MSQKNPRKKVFVVGRFVDTGKRKTIKVDSSVWELIKDYSKKTGKSFEESSSYMIKVAYGRLNALIRYNKPIPKKRIIKKKKIKAPKAQEIAIIPEITDAA